MLQSFGFEKQGGNAHRGRVVFAQIVEQTHHCIACVDDVFHKNNVASFEVLAEPHDLLHVAGRSCSLVAFQAHERQLGINVFAGAEKINRERSGSVGAQTNSGVAPAQSAIIAAASSELVT